MSGHMRVDLGNSMTKGNMIMLKGPSNSGKTTFAFSTIDAFLKEDPTHKAIYVGLTHNAGK